MDANSPKSGECCCKRRTTPEAGENVARQPVADPSVWSAPWVVGKLPTPAGDVPRVETALTWADRLGAWKVRWAIGRMAYRVPPGLYAVGNPTDESPVLVTANYKLTFDSLRRQLSGRDAWLLALDTKAVNVWCAAAKGTFGAEEIARRIEAVNLPAVVSHDVLVLPQLAAVGVTAHEVHKRSGFRVVFGPVYAADLPAFLDAGVKSESMRLVRFSLWDRLALVPVELVRSSVKIAAVAVCLLLLAGWGADGYSTGRVASVGALTALLFVVAAVGSLVLGPALLPWLPGRAFSCKGFWLGLALALLLLPAWRLNGGGWPAPLDLAAWCLAVPAIASFLTVSFTGSTPFTSLSGVRKEMRRALPLQVAAVAAALVVWFAGRFV